MERLTAENGAPPSHLCFGTMLFGGTARYATSREVFDSCRAN